ncbi:hypothetical protein I317_07572 [Kwoniella heveanensis CBS 569]|nr:hypothetical protein I317_07572 [Kwoniella heveanensis CBS 569]
MASIIPGPQNHSELAGPSSPILQPTTSDTTQSISHYSESTPSRSQLQSQNRPGTSTSIPASIVTTVQQPSQTDVNGGHVLDTSNDNKSHGTAHVAQAAVSGLIFQPPSASASAITAGTGPDLSPTCLASTRVVEPLKIPQPTTLPLTIETPLQTVSTVNSGSMNTNETTSSPTSASSHGRRGSLAYFKSSPGTFGDRSKNTSKDRDGTSANGSTDPTPIVEMTDPHVGASMSTGTGTARPTSSGSRKGKEAYEMITVAPAAGSVGKQRTDGSMLTVDTNKEDMAMAKWRKWIVEQPIQTIPVDTSPIRSGRASPAIGSGPITHGAASPRVSMLSSPRANISPRHPSPSGLEPHRSNSAESSSSALARAGLSPHHVSSRFGSGDLEVFNTESVMALRDVELAVDDEILERAERAKALPRRMSTQPRISELPNPFSEIAQRLGSRRVRPIVLELVQALGHFVDAVWCTHYPDRPCPWILGVDESPTPVSIRRMTTTFATDAEAKAIWKSPMITAVQEGKKGGHVGTPPSIKDIKFWGAEVTFSIRDVDEVVGICKGVGWAFGAAMRDGDYGAVVPENVLGLKGEGGGMVRLLNDLEEAIWGDAPPRPTDLSYDLPIDFDPYAIPDDVELLAAASVPRGPVPITDSNGRKGSSALASFFADSRASPVPGQESATGAVHASPMQVANEDEIYAVPDLVEARDDLSEADVKSDGVVSPRLLQGVVRAIPGIDVDGAEELTLEELGQKRHREWLESRRAGGAGAW